MLHVTYNEYNGWNENKKKVMYVVPNLEREKWKDNVDEMYIGGHLINDYHNTSKKSANVAFSYFFQIYSIQEFKTGDELLVNYNNRAKKRLSSLAQS